MDRVIRGKGFEYEGRRMRDEGREKNVFLPSSFFPRIFILSFVLYSVCFAQEPESQEKVTQFFIKVAEEGICGGQTEVGVFALDSYGLIAKDYSGIKKAKVQVKEAGGKKEKSYGPLPDTLEFRNGQASFFITDSEPETLEIRLGIGENISPFPGKVLFKARATPERLIFDLASRGDINKPLQAKVLVVDKKGNIAADYSAGGFIINVEELGAADKSFKLEPPLTAMSSGQASFSLSDPQEEELVLRLQDPKGVLQAAEARVVFSLPDNEPPQILEVKMDALAFVELTFNEELDDATATDPNNYEVSCGSVQRPRSVELHKNKVILELDDLLRPHDSMYVTLKNIRDLSGNSVGSGSRSPNYAVPHLPLHIEFRPSANSSPINTSITVSLTVRCTSGRVPQFVNGRFQIQVAEATPDNSVTLSTQEVEMQKGIGEFSLSDSSAEKVTLTVSDPESAVDPGTLELEFI